MSSRIDPSPSPAPTSRRFTWVAGRITGLAALGRALALVTSPLTARALGATGRGNLAAIVVPITIIPWLIELGLPTYASRITARGKRLGVVAGTLVPLGLVIGLIGMVLAWPIASSLARGRSVVETYLLIGLLCLPIFVVSDVLFAMLVGLERWTRVYVTKLLQPGLLTVVIVILYATHSLSVATAAIATIATGLVANLPSITFAWETRPIAFDRATARDGISFSLKAWLGSLGSLANLRLDQLLMIVLVTPRQLGLYVVAVNVAGLVNIFTTGVETALIPRAARGEARVTAQALRVTLVLLTASAALVAAVSYWFVPVFFGNSFRDAVPIVWILLMGQVAFEAKAILSSALVVAGRPGAAVVGETIALALTIPGLFLLLPVFAARGAAIVSVAAYGASFAYLLFAARRCFGSRMRDLLVMQRQDAIVLAGVASRGLGRARRRFSSS